jgi:hypothetical protein
MNPDQRVVTQIPLAELWTERGRLPAARVRPLDRAELVALLHGGAVQFIVADPGHPLRWIPQVECYVFWKAEVRAHLVSDPGRPFDIYHFPEGYAYVASEWAAEDPASRPIVLLERHH